MYHVNSSHLESSKCSSEHLTFYSILTVFSSLKQFRMVRKVIEYFIWSSNIRFQSIRTFYVTAKHSNPLLSHCVAIIHVHANIYTHTSHTHTHTHTQTHTIIWSGMKHNDVFFLFSSSSKYCHIIKAGNVRHVRAQILSHS